VWEVLVHKAERAVAAEAAETDKEMDKEMDKEIDKEIETDQATEAAPDQGTASARPERLNRLQKACLEFCIALLDHRITC
jgi:hypothetical protein